MSGVLKNKLIIREHCLESIEKVSSALVKSKCMECSSLKLSSAIMTAIEFLLIEGCISLRKKDDSQRPT